MWFKKIFLRDILSGLCGSAVKEFKSLAVAQRRGGFDLPQSSEEAKKGLELIVISY